MIELYSASAMCPASSPSRSRACATGRRPASSARRSARAAASTTRSAICVAVKAAKDLLATGMPLQKVRKNVDALKKALPDDTHPSTRLRVCCDGETIVALADDVAFQPIGGQVVMAFNVPASASTSRRCSRCRASIPTPSATPTARRSRSRTTPTEANGGTTAYRHFVEACAAEDRGDSRDRRAPVPPGDRPRAEHGRRADEPRQPRLSPGRARGGARASTSARSSTTRSQPEARYNLANLLEDLGETDARDRRAPQGLRRRRPSSPTRTTTSASCSRRSAAPPRRKQHLERYLELDAASDWAGHARTYLDQIAA